MKMKLTLSMDKEVIIKAKMVAKSSGRSLSGMIESYLKTISLPARDEPAKKISPLISAIRGSIKLPPGMDYDKILSEELIKKYNK